MTNPARVCRILPVLAEQTIIRVRINLVQHTQPNNMRSNVTITRNSDQDNAWPPNTLGAGETEDDIQQQTPIMENNFPGLGEQM